MELNIECRIGFWRGKLRTPVIRLLEKGTFDEYCKQSYEGPSRTIKRRIGRMVLEQSYHGAVSNHVPLHNLARTEVTGKENA